MNSQVRKVGWSFWWGLGMLLGGVLLLLLTKQTPVATDNALFASPFEPLIPWFGWGFVAAAPVAMVVGVINTK